MYGNFGLVDTTGAAEVDCVPLKLRRKSCATVVAQGIPRVVESTAAVFSLSAMSAHTFLSREVGERMTNRE